MGYIGNQTSNSYSSMDKQTITGNGGTSYTLTHSVANAQEIEVFVNNVRQEPAVAYTVSGTALTMTGNVASSDDFYVIYQGKALQTVVPPDDSVTTARINDGAVTTAKINDGAVTNAKINTMAASKLTGALPAIDGSSLTGLSSGFTFLSDQTLSGNSQVTFTGIPSGVNIVKFIVGKLSWNTTATVRMRLGDSGGLETSGYATGDVFSSTGSGSGGGSSEDSFRITQWTGAANILSMNGEITRTLSNEYLLTASVFVNTAHLYWVSWHGYKALSSELTQLQFYMSSGSFDSGLIRVAYQ